MNITQYISVCCCLICGLFIMQSCYTPETNTRESNSSNSNYPPQTVSNTSAIPYSFADVKVEALKIMGLENNYQEIHSYLSEELLVKNRIEELFPNRKIQYGNNKPDIAIVAEISSELAEGGLTKQKIKTLKTNGIDILSEYYEQESFLKKLLLACPEIIVGEVVDIKNDNEPSSDGFARSVTIKIQEVLKGKISQPLIIIRQKGSVDSEGKYYQSTSADPNFNKNEKWMFFASKTLYTEEIMSLVDRHSREKSINRQPINEIKAYQELKTNNKYAISGHSFQLAGSKDSLVVKEIQ